VIEFWQVVIGVVGVLLIWLVCWAASRDLEMYNDHVLLSQLKVPDILVRAAKTFVQTFVSAEIASNNGIIVWSLAANKMAFLSAGAAAVSLIWNTALGLNTANKANKAVAFDAAVALAVTNYLSERPQLLAPASATIGGSTFTTVDVPVTA